MQNVGVHLFCVSDHQHRTMYLDARLIYTMLLQMMALRSAMDEVGRNRTQRRRRQRISLGDGMQLCETKKRTSTLLYLLVSTSTIISISTCHNCFYIDYFWVH